MKEKIRKILILLCLAIFVASAGYLVYYFAVLSSNSQVYDDLQETVVETPAPTPTPAAEQDEILTEEEPELFTVDFDALHEINADAYAWIEIPDNEVSYPIMRHPTDDSYYLNYTIENVYGLPGSIYTERCDTTDFSDFNTVIYGHNMANDTMFGSLNNYRDRTYFDEHSTIYIHTETEVREYQIFAAVVYDNRYIPSVYNDTSAADRQAFLDSIYNNNNGSDIINTDITVTTESNLITLSTCIGDQPNNRYLLVAVYVGER